MGACVQQQQTSTTSTITTQNHYNTKPLLYESKDDITRAIGSGFTGNGFQPLIETLQCNLSLFPKTLIIIIAKFCHIGLKEPANTGHDYNKNNIFETIRIDKTNSLLIYYMPDTDTLRYDYSDWVTARYDYIQSNISFNPYPYNIKHGNMDYGNIVYFEIGFRSKNWKKYVDANDIKINGGMVGWTKHSVGFHSDDGKIFIEAGREAIQTSVDFYGEQIGDIVGCGYNYNAKTVFFTKNGKLVYCGDISFIDGLFDAVIAIKATDEMIETKLFHDMNKKDRECLLEINYGTKPFQFNIENYNEIIRK